MPEIRRHPITGAPVLLAPERGTRPGAWGFASGGLPVAADECPFCPGNEESTPPELERIGEGGHWEMRVVPNKYPAVEPAPEGPSHEVLIETAEHGRGIDRWSNHEVERAIGLWTERYRLHASRAHVRYVSIFRNEGALAGQSIEHPHSQLISLPFVPPRIELELDAFARAKACPLCALVRSERADTARLVDSHEGAILLCPDGSRYPYEMWVVEARHEPHWDRADAAALARLVATAVRALRQRFPGVSFNVSLITAPVNVAGAGAFHSYVEIAPRMASFAGYELGTGGMVNIVEPERAAAELRGRI